MLYANFLMRRDAVSGIRYLEELRSEGSFDHWERSAITKQLYFAYLAGNDRVKATEMLGELRRLEDEDWESGLLTAVYEDATGTAPVLQTDLSETSNSEATATESYPDPFNVRAAIRYTVSVQGPVTVRVFDVTGREVSTLVNEDQSPGEYTTHFDASGLPSGLYIYRVTTAAGSATGQMHLLK